MSHFESAFGICRFDGSGDSSWLWVDGQLTTAQQRRLLFATCQATGNLTPACRSAQLGCRTCYSGKPRFDQRGSAALDQFASFAPKGPFVRAARGTPFTAHAFAAFAQDTGCIHVPIARHRPETHGIAERCVRTLQEWLLQYAWQSDHALADQLRQCCASDNDRPQQGIGIPGRSPNRFARRIWRF